MAFSRRELIRRLGLTMGSLPLLDALGRNTAFAADPLRKRLVCIYLPHGVFAQNWLPFVKTGMPISKSSPGNMLKPPSAFLREVAFEQRTGCTAIDLTPYTGALSPVLSSKWQSFKSKTAFINNLGCSNMQVQGHTLTAALGGYKNPDFPQGTEGGIFNMTGETIDTVIGRKLNGQRPLVLRCPDWVDDAKFLEEAWSPSVRAKSGGGFEMAPALRDPIRVWDQLFASYTPPVSGPKKRDPNKRRTALLEQSLKNLSSIKNEQRLSAFDKQRIDNHASIIEAQHKTLSEIVPPSEPVLVAPPARPTVKPGDQSATFNPVKGTLFRAQFANAAAALKMNKAQAITIDTALENEWLSDGLNLGSSQAYHGSAGHLANPSDAIIEEIRKVQEFIFDSIADFIKALDVVEDPASGATYLDNTMVLVTSEHDGRPNGHLRGAVSSILVGGFGSFKGGKSYDFSTPALQQEEASCIYQGVSYSRLLYTVLQSFGASSSTMGIQGIAQDWQGADMADWNKPLTGLL